MSFLTRKLIAVNDHATAATAAKEEAERRIADLEEAAQKWHQHQQSQPPSTLPSADNSVSLDSSTFANHFTQESNATSVSPDDESSKPPTETDEVTPSPPHSLSKAASEPVTPITPAPLDDDEVAETLGEPALRLPASGSQPGAEPKSPSKKKRPSKKKDGDVTPSKRSRPSKSTDAVQTNGDISGLMKSTKETSGHVNNKKEKERKKSAPATANRRRTVASNASSTKSSIVEDMLEEDEIPPLKASAIPKEIFTTDREYNVVSVREAKEAAVAAECLDCDIDVLPRGRQEHLEVPRFRILTFPTITSPEGTEVGGYDLLGVYRTNATTCSRTSTTKRSTGDI